MFKRWMWATGAARFAPRWRRLVFYQVENKMNAIVNYDRAKELLLVP